MRAPPRRREKPRATRERVSCSLLLHFPLELVEIRHAEIALHLGRLTGLDLNDERFLPVRAGQCDGILAGRQLDASGGRALVVTDVDLLSLIVHYFLHVAP